MPLNASIGGENATLLLMPDARRSNDKRKTIIMDVIISVQSASLSHLPRLLLLPRSFLPLTISEYINHEKVLYFLH
jgi:hypothetical protein